jgi:hypothetical protein
MLRTMLIAGWLLVFTLLVFFGDQILPEVMSFDSEIITRIMDDAVDFQVGESGSYGAVASFFRAIPPPFDIVFILTVGWSSFLLFLLPLKHERTVLLAFYMILPPMLSAMVRIQKELIVITLAMAVLFVATRERLNGLLKVLAIGGLYSGYAYFFGRDYYYVIATVFVGTLAFVRASIIVRFLMVMVGLCALLLVPVDWLDQLQGVRDRMSFYRVGVSAIGYRTAFANVWDVDSLPHFLGNYANAFARLNMPMFFDLGVWKGWYWFTVVITYCWVLSVGFRKGDAKGRLLLALYVSHVIVLNMFEPDAGTYTRHVTSVFLYMLPGLLVLDRQWIEKRLAYQTQVAGSAREDRMIQAGQLRRDHGRGGR